MARPKITEERRRQILEAAAAVIAERGMCETRIADVARRLEISPALILYYFSSKDVLLAQTLAFRDRQFFEAAEENIRDVNGAVERLHLLIEACIPPQETRERHDSVWYLWLETWSRSRHDPQLAGERLRLDRELRRVIADLVEQGVAEGTMTCDDPAGFAMMLSSLIDGLAIQVLLQDPEMDGARMGEMVRQVAWRQLSIG